MNEQARGHGVRDGDEDVWVWGRGSVRDGRVCGLQMRMGGCGGVV